MANYSYQCGFCGYTILSDDKETVRKAKAEHNRKERNPFFPLHGPEKVRTDCVLGRTNKGTLARPELIPVVNARVA